MIKSEDDERQPLISSGTVSQGESAGIAEEEHSCCRWRKKCFFVEPVIILFAVSAYPMSIVSSRYLLDWFTDHPDDFTDGRNNSDDGKSNATISGCHGNASNGGYGDEQYAQSRASQFALYESLLVGIPSLFATVILGTGSDRFGRRFAMIPPMFGAFAASLIFTTVVLTNSSIYWFFLADFVNGFCGSLHSMMMACMAFIADQNAPDRRMYRMLILELCLLVTGILSPIINGTILQTFGYFYPLLFVVFSSALNLIYVAIFFPRNTRLNQDHLPPSEDDSLSAPSSFFSIIWKQMLCMFNIFFKRSEGSSWRRLKLNLLVIALLVTSFASAGQSVLTFFIMNSPLCWSLDTIGLFTTVSSAVSGLGALILTPLLKCCRIPDSLIASISSLALVATNLYKVFVTDTIMMFLSLSFSVLEVLFSPSLLSLLSSQVSEEEQGALLGAIMSLRAICSMVGGSVFNSIYSLTLFISTGFVFLVMAAVYLLGCIPVYVYLVLTTKLNTNTTKDRSTTAPVIVNNKSYTEIEKQDQEQEQDT